MSAYKIFVFDAYGTLFDVHSAVARHRAAIGPQADRLSDIWRTKQLEYTWVLSLMESYRDFAALTEDALDFAAARCGGITPDTRAALLAAYQTLDAYADVKPCLQALKAAGKKTAILSNGTPAMLAAAVQHAGLDGLIDATLSVDPIRTFKTAPEAYHLASYHFRAQPGEVSFQSSNRWDVAGAVRFGFRALWINRTAQPHEYAEFPPERVLPGLEGVG